MASFKAKFPVLQELFAKNHRGDPLGPPPAGRGLTSVAVLQHRVFSFRSIQLRRESFGSAPERVAQRLVIVP